MASERPVGYVLDHDPHRRLYPVPVKPPSGITGWYGWPEDVRNTIHRWNGKGLTFSGSQVFKCADCERFCQQRNHCHFTRGEWQGDHVCDDCMIARARADGPA